MFLQFPRQADFRIIGWNKSCNNLWGVQQIYTCQNEGWLMLKKRNVGEEFRTIEILLRFSGKEHFLKENNSNFQSPSLHN